MAGVWQPQQFHDLNGKPYPGALAHFYEANTDTPITVFSDYDLTTALSSPVVADSAGIFPAVFLDESDLFYAIRVETSTGSTLSYVAKLPIIGPPVAASDSVDTALLHQTGDLKARYGTGAHTGWVRANGRTLGGSGSGATERANADTETLFEYLWGADSNLTVSTGRGSTAADDFAAGKTIALPDWRGMTIAGLDDMGNSAASRLTGSTIISGGGATTLGASGGAEEHTLTLPESAAHDHSGVTGGQSVTHTHSVHHANTVLVTASDTNANVTNLWQGQVSEDSGNTSVDHTHTIASAGGGGAHNNLQPTRLCTIYMKL